MEQEASPRFEDFSIGDEVYYENMGKGVVAAIEPYRGTLCVIVDYEDGSRGAYDEAWFKKFHRLSRKTGGQS